MAQMISDELFGYAMASNRNMRSFAEQCQAIITRKNRELNELERLLAAERRKNAELLAERGKRNAARIAAEMERRRSTY